MSIDLVHVDCLKFLKGMPDASVDMVLTDPPYGIGYDDGAGWDNQWASEKEYLDWCQEWSYEAARVLKPGRMLVVWGTLKTDTFLKYKLDVLNSLPGMVGQNEVIWSYNWGGRTRKNFARKHEYAWCYSKGENFLFNGDAVRVERKMTKSMRDGSIHTKGTIPTSVWEKNNHTMSKDNISWHPTPKNVDILRRLVRAYTNPGDVVLDCFAGSAATAVACIREERSFIGCELSGEYFLKAQRRIQKEMVRD